MRILLLTISLLFAAGAQQHPAMPEPGNPGHQEPAPGAMCVHAGPGVDAGSACACEPKCMDGHDPDGTPNGEVNRQEDNARCRAACHPKHCACVSNCEP